MKGIGPFAVERLKTYKVVVWYDLMFQIFIVRSYTTADAWLKVFLTTGCPSDAKHLVEELKDMEGCNNA